MTSIILSEYERAMVSYYLQSDSDAELRTRKTSEDMRPKPLEDQIAELMRSVPPSVRNRPWTMVDLVHRLNGKYRDRPHGQQVGEALLRLGWRKERRWGKDFGGARIWLGPQT